MKRDNPQTFDVFVHLLLFSLVSWIRTNKQLFVILFILYLKPEPKRFCRDPKIVKEELTKDKVRPFT